MAFLIRRAEVADARGMAAVGIETWRAAYAGIVPQAMLDSLELDARAAAFRGHLSAPQDRRGTWIGLDGERVVGFASYGPCRDADSETAGEIYALYVIPERWGTGLGSELLARALADLKRLELAPVALWVLSDNPRARRFYEREGFALERERVQKDVRGTTLDHARYVRARP